MGGVKNMCGVENWAMGETWCCGVGGVNSWTVHEVCWWCIN